MKSSLILFGFGKPVLDLYSSLCSDFIIHGIHLDYQRSKEKYSNFYRSISERNITLLSKQETIQLQCDALVVINFNKLITTTDYFGKKLINIHMGVLPKYRGNNANAWAILNGEREVGYSVHSISEELDAGDIYFTFKCEVGELDTYNNSKELIDLHLYNNISKNIQRILGGDIIPNSQQGEEFIYCSKLISEDGFISNWDLDADLIIRKFQVFAEPRGTGLWFILNGMEYCITDISKIPGFANSPVGFNGAVVKRTLEGGIWIKVRDTAIEIKSLRNRLGKVIKPADIISIGQRL